MNFGRTGGSTAGGSWTASLGSGSGAGFSGGLAGGSGAAPRPLWAMAAARAQAGARAQWTRAGPRAAAGARRGAGSGAGLASFSPFMTWLRSLSDTVSIGIASELSVNLGAEPKPNRIAASSAPCSVAEPAKLQYVRRSSNAAPGYCLIGSVTRATFLNPAEVTAAMISATRP